MSVELHPTQHPKHPTGRPIDEIARGFHSDSRLTAVVPGFDAPFFQAGLAGYSDAPMRLVARRHGCPFAVTEALLDRTLISGGKGRTREDPNLLAEQCGTGDPCTNRPPEQPEQMLESDKVAADALNDHPIAGQIIGSEPEEMARGSQILVDMGYDVIDVNLACPVKKIRKRNRGGHLLSSPDEAIAILESVRGAVPARLPTTVKLRRAYDDTDEMAANFDRIFNAAYEIGYAWATVHCRTVEQKYVGPGRWEFLTDLVARHQDRLILGSGDVWTVHDIFAMLETTGVAAVSVARGCIGNPWIFRQARQMMAGAAPIEPTLIEQRQVLLDHFGLSVRLHGEKAASMMMRKFGIKFAMHHPKPEAVKASFVTCRNVADWREVIECYYAPDSD